VLHAVDDSQKTMMELAKSGTSDLADDDFEDSEPA
jgi:hypothetical protein